MDLLVLEVQALITGSINYADDWLRATFTALNTVLPSLQEDHLDEFPESANSYLLHAGHLLLWDSWQTSDQRKLIEPRLRPYGFSAAFVVLAAENCIHAATYRQQLPALDSLSSRSNAMQLLQAHVLRAAMCWGFVQAVIPHESESLLAQTQRRNQQAGQVAYEALRQEALALWQQGLEAGRWRPSGHGDGRVQAAIQITLQLQSRAAALLTGKNARRGIADGSHALVYRWIRQATETSRKKSSAGE
ncbi:hypothetical protein [Nevskia sp.]|uniref:hypothetical protein n=1 Tax=Nevskia sp. TaxID=1929292 RepID=UPI0025CE7B6C|nr:hypothetical protein [Nevskia sp.]